MEPSWFLDLIRTILLWFDTIVYNLIDLVYQLFMMISETGVFSAESIRDFAGRIYFFLGLIMIFKVSISIVQFIVNPDSVKDNKIGAPKLLKNIALVLIGIILVPYVFEAAYSLQRIVLRDNIIGNLILGMKYTEGDQAEDYIKTSGKRMAFTSFSAFFHLNTDIEVDDGQLFTTACAANPYTATGEVNTAACSENAVSILNDFVGNSRKNLNYVEAYVNNDISYIRKAKYNYEIKDKFDEKQYLFDYTILVSTFAGGFIVYILLGFCVDIAVRNVKLGFLQLIAPVPLIAKIDPKKGEDVFNRWVKQCVSTYFDLFGRLIAIYFAVFLLSLITDGFVNVVEPDKDAPDNIFVKLFFIIGILNFAKALPKLLEDIIPGLKLGDGKGLGLRNKLAGTPLVGGAANKALGLAGRTGKNLAKGTLHAAGKGLGKLTRFNALKGSTARAIAPKIEALRKGASKIGGKVDKVTGGALGDIGRDIGGTFTGMGASLMNNLGMLESRKNQILNRQSTEKLEMERNKSMASANDAIIERAKSKVKESVAYAQKEQHIETLRKQAENLITTGASKNVIEAKEKEIAQAVADFGKWANKDGVYEYIDKTGEFARRNEDDVLNAIIEKRDDTAKALGYKDRFVAKSAKEADDAAGELKNVNRKIEGRFADGNNEIARIDEQIRAAKDFNSGR